RSRQRISWRRAFRCWGGLARRSGGCWAGKDGERRGRTGKARSRCHLPRPPPSSPVLLRPWLTAAPNSTSCSVKSSSTRASSWAAKRSPASWGPPSARGSSGSLDAAGPGGSGRGRGGAAASVGCEQRARQVQDEAELKQAVQQMIPAVERATRLRFRRHPVILRRTREQVREYVIHKFDDDLPPAELVGAQAAYRLFGLIPDTLDLRRTMVDLLTEQ